MDPSLGGKLTLEELAALVEDGAVATVMAASVDLHGRLKGTRFHAHHFLEKARRGFPSGDVFPVPPGSSRQSDGHPLNPDLAMVSETTMRPDLETLRRAAWLPGTAVVLCDVLDAKGRALVPFSPRRMLQRQVDLAKEAGFDVLASTDLEFATFQSGPEELKAAGYGALSSPFDGALRLGATDDRIVSRLRDALFDSGVPVESTREGAAPGQHALGLAVSPAVAAADHHALAKHAAKGIAVEEGRAVSFLPQLHPETAGSAATFGLSLWKGRDPVFYDETLALGVSRLMRSFVAGMIRGIDDCTVFLAPRINSYKRFSVDRLAPTRKVWTQGSRNAAFRLCGAGRRSIRVECRVPGADANPYLVMAGLLAAGLDGIRQHLDCGDPVEDDAFDAGIAHIPRSLSDATLALRSSVTLRKAFGDAVIDHYVRAAEWEQSAFDRAVTDWELLTGFDTA